MKKYFKKTLNIFLIVIIIICSFQIIHKLFQYYKEDKNYSKIKEIKPSKDTSLNIKDLPQDIKLKAINPEYKFWINIPNSSIDYPVVQGKNNEFYLNKNFYKEESESGAIFIDYRNNIDSDKNIIIYGHNMNDGSMFNGVSKFKKLDNFNNGIIKIIKNNKEYNYEVFSVFVENENYTGLKNNFTSDEDYIKYIEYLKKKSIYTKDSDKTNYSNIITLYTCSYDFDGARTIVSAGLKKSNLDF